MPDLNKDPEKLGGGITALFETWFDKMKDSSAVVIGESQEIIQSSYHELAEKSHSELIGEMNSRCFLKLLTLGACIKNSSSLLEFEGGDLVEALKKKLLESEVWKEMVAMTSSEGEEKNFLKYWYVMEDEHIEDTFEKLIKQYISEIETS